MPSYQRLTCSALEVSILLLCAPLPASFPLTINILYASGAKQLTYRRAHASRQNLYCRPAGVGAFREGWSAYLLVFVQ